MMRRWRKFIPLTLIFLLSLMFVELLLIPTPSVYTSPDSVQKSPSAYENNAWTNPTYAYSSDDNWASESTVGDCVTYKNYSFENSISEGSTINSVVVKCEGYVSVADQKVQLRVSWDGGTTWSSWNNFGLTTSESTKTLDVTSVTSWTRDKLNNTNFRVKLEYYEPAEGCFPNQTYFISWNETAKEVGEMPWVLKRIDKAEVGDMILCSNHWEGIHWDEIAEVNVHNGTWEIYDIWSGKVFIKYKDEKGHEKEYEWIHHGQVTGNHPALVLRNEEWIVTTASDVRLTDETRHIHHEKIELEEGEWVPLENHTLSTEAIEKIDVFNFTGLVYDVKTDDTRDWIFMTFISDAEMAKLKVLEKRYGVNLGSYIDPLRAQKWTGYVDWLPVEVTYTPPDNTPPNYSNVGTNTTIAGQPCLFYTKWTDNINMSGYIFGTNNTGSWNNDTWAEWSPIGTPKWSNVTKTLNDTVGVRIEWCFWANDTSNNWNNTGIQYFLTTSANFTVTFYFHIGGSLLVNGSSTSNGTSGSYAPDTMLNITGVANYQYEFKNHTYDSSSTTDNPFYLIITQDYTVHTYFRYIYDCNYIGVNSTIAGEPSKFSSSWEDLYNAEGLSHYLLSTNNTGSWVNETWSNSWVSTYWAEETVTLNSTNELVISFKYYVNDTNGYNYVSTICFFTTSTPTADATFNLACYFINQTTVSGANVSLTDSGSVEIFHVQTNSSGQIPTQNAPYGSDPHTLKVFKEGIRMYQSVFNTENGTIDLILTLTPREWVVGTEGITFEQNIISDLKITYVEEFFRFNWQGNRLDIKLLVVYNTTKQGIKHFSLRDFWRDVLKPEGVKRTTVINQVTNHIYEFGLNVSDIPIFVADRVQFVYWKLEGANFDLSEIKMKNVLGDEGQTIVQRELPSNLGLSFEDLWAYNYTVTHPNVSYCIVEGINGKQSWNLDPITYSSGVLYIEGFTEGDRCSLQDICDVNDENAWGVVDALGANQFEFTARIEFGVDGGGTATWFADTDAQILLADNTLPDVGGMSWITVHEDANFKLGELLDAEDKITGKGCIVLDQQIAGSVSHHTMSVSGTAELYGTIFDGEKTHQGRGWDDIYIDWNGTATLYDCNLYGVAMTAAGISNLYNVEIKWCWMGLYLQWNASQSELENILIYDCVSSLVIDEPLDDFYITELSIVEPSYDSFVITVMDYDCYLINPTLPDEIVCDHFWTDFSVWEQFTFDLNVIDSDGNAINGETSGARVVIEELGEDGDGVVYNATLGTDGTIPTQNLTRYEYFASWGVNASILEPDVHTPHQLTIYNAIGYQDYNGNFTVSEKTDWTIALKENNSPTARFSFTPSNPRPHQTISFDGTDSSDADGTISSYSWTFGDGDSDTGNTTTHAYTTDGSFNVTLTVTDDDGATDSFSQTVTVLLGGTSTRIPQILTVSLNPIDSPEPSLLDVWLWKSTSAKAYVTLTSLHDLSQTVEVTWWLTYTGNSTVLASGNRTVELDPPFYPTVTATIPFTIPLDEGIIPSLDEIYVFHATVTVMQQGIGQQTSEEICMPFALSSSTINSHLTILVVAVIVGIIALLVEIQRLRPKKHEYPF